MPLELVTFAYVEHDGPAPSCTRKTVTAEIARYLEAHIDDLQGRAESGRSPSAKFLSSDARNRFTRLRRGEESDFLQAAQELATRLHSEMDGRTKAGFFVAIRRSMGRTTQGIVLKLDVHDKDAAAVKRAVRTGERELEAVRDLLDIPGELQKGAITPDSRAGSEVVVGDKFEETSLYFLRALDVQQMSQPTLGAVTVVAQVQTVAPARVPAVVEALQQEPRVTTEEFFQRHPNIRR
jgi:hypothetical protein